MMKLMRRLVIDSSMLQSEDLRLFLNASAANFAVLPDFVWFELYKQESIEAIVAGMSVIGDFPEQVIVLKPGKEIVEIDPRTPNMTSSMQRSDVAHQIRGMVAILDGPDRDEPGVRAQLERLWSGAVNALSGMLEGAHDILVSLPEMAEQMFTPQHLRIIRRNTRYTPEMFSSIFGAADQIWETLSGVTRIPPARRPKNSERKPISTATRLRSSFTCSGGSRTGIKLRNGSTAQETISSI